MTVYEMAKKYYPDQWNDARIDALVESGKLTFEEAEAIKTGEDISHVEEVTV